jgi:glutathione S-transferase
MHQRLGATSRLYLYNRSLRERPNRGPTAVLLAQGSSLIERLIFPWMFKSIIYKGILSVTKARKDENAQLAVEEIRKVFSDVSSRLEGRQYLFGDRFTAADLTFASMSTLLVPPSNLDPIIPGKYPQPSTLNPQPPTPNPQPSTLNHGGPSVQYRESRPQTLNPICLP